MTNEEAIEILRGAIKKPNTKDGYLGQALDMAIEALEQQPCDDYVDKKELLKSIEVALDATDINDEYSIGLRNGMRLVKSFVDGKRPDYEKVSHLKKQQPCDDAISRQALRQKLREHHDFFVNAYGGFNNLSLNDKFRVDEITNCIAMVVNAPSVTPQPKIGEWLKNGELCKCSRCGGNVLFSAVKSYNYCYRCGAKMEVGE